MVGYWAVGWALCLAAGVGSLLLCKKAGKERPCAPPACGSRTPGSRSNSGRAPRQSECGGLGRRVCAETATGAAERVMALVSGRKPAAAASGPVSGPGSAKRAAGPVSRLQPTQPSSSTTSQGKTRPAEKRTVPSVSSPPPPPCSTAQSKPVSKDKPKPPAAPRKDRKLSYPQKPRKRRAKVSRVPGPNLFKPALPNDDEVRPDWRVDALDFLSDYPPLISTPHLGAGKKHSSQISPRNTSHSEPVPGS